MKCSVLFFVVALAIGIQAKDPKPVDKLTAFLLKLKAVRTECLAATKVDLEIVKKADQGIIEDDPKLKEHLLCYLKKFDCLEETGHFDKVVSREILLTIMPKETAEIVMEKCLHKRGGPQETAYKYFLCAFNYVPKEIFQKVVENVRNVNHE